MTRHVPFLCPKCGKPMTRVIQTLAWQGTIRRRRRCANGHTAETRETLRDEKSAHIAA